MSKELYSTSALHRHVRYAARAEIMECIGDLSGVELFGTQLLLAPYVQSGLLRQVDDDNPILSITELCERYAAGKHFLAPKLSTESLYQGKVCLVVKIGNGVDVNADQYGDKPLRVGDWVYTLQENTRGVSICAPGGRQSRVLKALGVDYTGWPCKFCYAGDIYGRLNDPNVLA